MLSSLCCCEYPVLLDVMIKIPHLRWDVLAWSHIQHVHTLTSPSIEAFLCGFMNHFSISCMCPLLLTALSVAHRHLHLLQPLGEGGGHRSAVVLPPKLVLTGEREKLCRSHEIMTSILAKVIPGERELFLDFNFRQLFL